MQRCGAGKALSNLRPCADCGGRTAGYVRLRRALSCATSAPSTSEMAGSKREIREEVLSFETSTFHNVFERFCR